MAVRYVVISPVRDEEAHLPLMVESMANQTIVPDRWVIVNDGSRDRTGAIADQAARRHSWISVVHRPDRGYRKAGGGVIDAFYEGYGVVEKQPWGFVVKLDGDLSFSDDYFEQCFKRFATQARLGIGGGTICSNSDGVVEVESKVDPRFHVRGATKIYRRECWEQLGGLIRAPGWDTLDEVKANMLGWTTETFAEIRAIQHRPTGAAYGAWNDKVKGGMANYIAGYHPLFMLVKCMRRMLERPYVLGGCGLLYGFAKGYLTRVPQVPDKALIRYFRQQQINRLLMKKSLWS